MAWAVDSGAGAVLLPALDLLLPHFMPTLTPSISRPAPHASAADSASALSVKLTKAQRDLATCTIDRIAFGLEDIREGRDCETKFLMEDSVEEGEREDRKRDV